MALPLIRIFLNQYAFEKISTSLAREITPGKAIRVGIIDSGIGIFKDNNYANHPDLPVALGKDCAHLRMQKCL